MCDEVSETCRSYCKGESPLQVLAKLNRGDLSAVDVTKACLQHIEAQKRLNAFVSVTADMALQQARESDNRRKQGAVSASHFWETVY